MYMAAAFRQTTHRALKQLRCGPPPAHRLSAQRTFTGGGGPQGDLETALELKNKIESAKGVDLFSNGNLIAQHCDQTERIFSQVSRRHAKVSRAMFGLTFKYICTGVVLDFVGYLIEGYYYNNAEFEFKQRHCQAGDE